MSSISVRFECKVSSIRLSILIAALGVLAMADRVCADEQTAAQKTGTSVIAEGISSNPDAVDVRTGTGELAEMIEGLVGLPGDTGVRKLRDIVQARRLEFSTQIFWQKKLIWKNKLPAEPKCWNFRYR